MSAGFDAARGDPLGGCLVSPEGYAHMTHLLMGLAGGRIALVLEVRFMQDSPISLSYGLPSILLTDDSRPSMPTYLSSPNSRVATT